MAVNKNTQTDVWVFFSEISSGEYRIRTDHLYAASVAL